MHLGTIIISFREGRLLNPLPSDVGLRIDVTNGENQGVVRNYMQGLREKYPSLHFSQITKTRTSQHNLVLNIQKKDPPFSIE